ncbi:protein of unknown function [Acetoanaerobium sticklandii]|uniref:Uncharacterized protein n=1 Tax=Acetoanaerobium sticklandii (strain ATCC 12662 / DSM 519 / JCM 1433 / CCUG 9281 / NCIMB 10654 / HF) TaxID=499177 RepID=E3PSK2_ACESD|nr:hypothetical protein [Acetoanaerobium sticklandii]CBH21856.1 protein of unknown function [Acetoanaerobium sticklandii]
MSDEAIIQDDLTAKESRFGALKTAILVVLGLLIIGIVSSTILYFTNSGVKTNIDALAKKAGLFQPKAESELQVDTRIKELSSYYLSLDIPRAADKLYALKQEDKKLYEELFSYMIGENSLKSSKIRDEIKLKEAKVDTLQREYESMQTEISAQRSADSTHYASLGVRGAINAIEESLTYNMDFTTMAKILETMQPNFVAKLLHYMNPTYSTELELSLSKEFYDSVKKEKEKYDEFLRKNTSMAQVYNKMDTVLAATKLEEPTEFNLDDLGLIFSKMDYFKASEILNGFSDDGYVSQVLESIKNYEDLESTFEGSLSTVISDSLRVLEEYERDTTNLRKAYEKMQPADLADIVDTMTNQNPSYKEYMIDDVRKFRITEQDMLVEVLKQAKPTVVSNLLSELKNTDRTQKAALLSRELGIPNP